LAVFYPSVETQARYIGTLWNRKRRSAVTQKLCWTPKLYGCKACFCSLCCGVMGQCLLWL